MDVVHDSILVCDGQIAVDVRAQNHKPTGGRFGEPTPGSRDVFLDKVFSELTHDLDVFEVGRIN